INENETVCGSCGSPQPTRTTGNATLLQRFAGAVIDAVILGVLLIPLFLMRAGGMRALMDTMRMAGQPFLIRWAIESFLATELAFLILNGYLLFRRGQTIGKLAMGTKIVGLDGNLPD